MNVNHYQVYSNLLKFDLQVQLTEALKNDHENNKLPEYFWILDGRGKHSHNLQLLDDGHFHKVSEITFKRVKGILYARNINQINNLKK
jgi:hypothetical protein